MVLTFGVVIAAASIGVYIISESTQSGAGSVPFGKPGARKPIAELRFQDGTGRPRSLADFQGKLVLVNIWATWCAPCREEMPTLERLQTELGGPDFEVVALSIDQQGPQVVRRFFDDIDIKALQLYVDPSAQAVYKLGAAGLPMTLLVDRAGREIGRHSGPAKWDAPEIRDYLAQRLREGEPR